MVPLKTRKHNLESPKSWQSPNDLAKILKSSFEFRGLQRAPRAPTKPTFSAGLSVSRFDFSQTGGTPAIGGKITSIAPSVEIFRLAFYMHNVYHLTDWWLILRINYRLFPNYV